MALKYANVRPAFKKDDKIDKESFRPMYDQMFLIYDQMYPFFDKIFSNSHCRLRKGFNAEQCLIRMIEN